MHREATGTGSRFLGNPLIERGWRTSLYLNRTRIYMNRNELSIRTITITIITTVTVYHM